MADGLKVTPKSYLLVDCGTANTTAILIDVVEGRYRLIGQATEPSTALAPWNDAFSGIQQVINQLMEMTGRRLLTADGDLIHPADANSTGVDIFGLTFSAAPALKTVLVGLLEEVSLGSGRRALNTIYAEEIEQLSLTDNREEKEQIDALLAQLPDLVLVTGGTDGGADDRLVRLVETVGLAISMMDTNRKPEVVFAGNSAMREKVVSLLNDIASVEVAENVRPSLDAEQLNDAAALIEAIYINRNLRQLPNIDSALSWCDLDPQPTTSAVGYLMDYFARLQNGSVLCVDIGAQSSSLIAATPTGRRQLVRTDLGMGRPLVRLLEETDLSEVMRFIPVGIEPVALRDFLLERSLRPHTIPATPDELALEQALVRYQLGQLRQAAERDWGWPADHMPVQSMLVARGLPLVGAAKPNQALLILLDALRPAGVFAVALDRYQVLPGLGLLAPRDPLTVVQVLAHNALDHLGWVVAPVGRAQPGQKVLNVRLKSERLGTLDVEVMSDTIEVLPLGYGEKAELQIEPLRRFNVGQGPGRGRKVKISGGGIGVVIDARQRPLQLAEEADRRREQLRQWQWEIGG